MKKIKTIKEKDLYYLLNVGKKQLLGDNFITPEDYKLMTFVRTNPSIRKKLTNSIDIYFRYAFRNPKFIKEFVLPRLFETVANSFGLRRDFIRDNKNGLRGLVQRYERRVRIAQSFKPKNILEIGTYLGVGAAAFKTAIPNCKVLTMSPRFYNSNDPVNNKQTGYYYKSKHLKVKQIWADSSKFNFSTLPRIDVAYIDGNHDYDYVYNDLQNCSRIVKKLVMLDDYVPEERHNDEAYAYGPWNEDVVRATDDFVTKYPDMFRHKYWIRNTQLCVLIK